MSQPEHNMEKEMKLKEEYDKLLQEHIELTLKNEELKRIKHEVINRLKELGVTDEIIDQELKKKEQ